MALECGESWGSIIVKSVSRFARNTSELLTTIRFLKDIGVSVYFEEQGIDTDKLNSEMIVTFPGMAAQQESEAISGNMRWSYKKRMESGEFNCCAPAYGFNLVDGSLVINETEAAVVRRIFSMYLQGYGKQTIANKLNEEGVPRRHGVKTWYAFGIDYMLNNERYMGDALLQKKYTTDTLPFRRKENRGECPQYYVENANPTIVSRETYAAVQELQKSRQKNAGGKKAAYPLTGVLRCPDCGRTYRRQLVRGKAYWICSGKASGATTCSSRRMAEPDVYEAFSRMLFKLKEHHGEHIIVDRCTSFNGIMNRSYSRYFVGNNLIKDYKEGRYHDFRGEPKYASSLVVPIRTYVGSPKEVPPYYDVIGFLCIDSKEKNQFLEGNPLTQMIIETTRAFADCLYLLISETQLYYETLLAKEG